MAFYLNKEKLEAELAITDQLILDKPFVMVNENELRLKWIEGYVSLIWIEIIPINSPPERFGSHTVYYESKSLVGSNC